MSGRAPVVVVMFWLVIIIIISIINNNQLIRKCSPPCTNCTILYCNSLHYRVYCSLLEYSVRVQKCNKSNNFLSSTVCRSAWWRASDRIDWTTIELKWCDVMWCDVQLRNVKTPVELKICRDDWTALTSECFWHYIWPSFHFSQSIAVHIKLFVIMNTPLFILYSGLYCSVHPNRSFCILYMWSVSVGI